MAKIDYTVIEKTYSPEIMKSVISFVTYDLPIHWSVRLKSSSLLVNFIGSDDQLELEGAKTKLTVTDERGVLRLNHQELDTKATVELSYSFPYTGPFTFKIRIEMPVIRTDSVSMDFKSFETVHDRVLVFGDEKFYVRSAFLVAWSNYFDVLFNGDFAEKDKNEVTIGEVDPVEFDELLKVIHPTRKDIDDSNVVYLWKLADRFDMPILNNMCEDYISTAPGFYTVPLSLFEKIELAQIMKSEKLEKKCRAITDMITYI